MKQITGNQIKDLVTKFFYKENHLCFQILVRLEGNTLIPFQEFEDYGEYKRVFGELQLATVNGSILSLLEKKFRLEPARSKVA
jgi:hypothetical protein